MEPYDYCCLDIAISSYTLLLAPTRCVESKYESRPIFSGHFWTTFLVWGGAGRGWNRGKTHGKNPKKRRNMGNLKMWMSTKPYSKLFNVVRNNILSTFQIIAEIYDDRIRPKCPDKLRKFADDGKPENVNIYWTILQTFQCGSQLLFINVSIHWEDIWWSYLSEMSPKTWKNCEKMKTWKCEYLLNHSTNFLVWFKTTFLSMFLFIERIYDDLISPKCPQKLWKFADNGKPENVNIY